MRAAAPRGTVQAFDARTGRLRWTWDPLIHDGIDAGAANVWAPMSADEKLGLVFLPTSSPSPDFWGGNRPGNNEHADSVVALRAETGELVWAFQTVHHDVWDYDLPAQPTLARIDTGAGQRDVVIQATKQGFLFVLDEATGQPIWPVEERPVPQGGAEGEQLSPTQPFPTHVPALGAAAHFGRRCIWPDQPRGLPRQVGARAQRGALHAALDPGHRDLPLHRRRRELGRCCLRSRSTRFSMPTRLRLVHIVTLIPAAEARGFKPAPGEDFGPQRGAAFAMTRAIARSPVGGLCNPPPWGALVAVDLKAGKILWQSTVGTTEDLAPLGLPFPWGTPVASGVLVTARGPGVHRRPGCLSARLRCQDRRRAVARPAAGARRRQSDDLCVAGRAIRRRLPPAAIPRPARRSATASSPFVWHERMRRLRCGRARSTGPAAGSMRASC